MFDKTLSVARKYGSQIAVGTGSLVASGLSMAQAVDPGVTIKDKVTAAMTSGEGIATAIVLGLFAIWAIKLLWRSK